MDTHAENRDRRRAVRAIALVVCLSAVAVWGLGLARFAAAIPARVTDSETPTDAIVVLTGGSMRIATGLALLAAGKAERVFVSGVDPTVELADVLALTDGGGTLPSERIEAGHGAVDTAGNARETAAWMHGRGYRSLRLVTGSYHMPRSLFEFRRALPDTRIVPHPVFPHSMRGKTWWRSPSTTRLIISEYHKFLIAQLRDGGSRLRAAAQGST